MEAALVLPVLVIALSCYIYIIQCLFQYMYISNSIANVAFDIQGKGSIYEFMFDYSKAYSQDKEKDVYNLFSKRLGENEYIDGAIHLLSESLFKEMSKKTFERLIEYKFEELIDDDLLKGCIKGGQNGVYFDGTSIDMTSSSFVINTRFTFKIPFFEQKSIAFPTGVTYQGRLFTTQLFERKKTTENENKKKLVYITSEGEVYHIDRACSYIQPIIMETYAEIISNMRNKSGGKYYPCERCIRQNENVRSGVKLYYSEYGTRYHITNDCSSIARSVLEVDISKVKNRRECSKCGNN